MFEIKSMTFGQFDKYQDYVEELEEKKVKQNKAGRLCAKWIIENIYGMDIETVELTPGQIMSVVSKTIEATLKEADIDEKN